MDFKNYLEKLRELPDKQKKIVLWTIVAVLGLAMGYFWIRGAMNSLQKLGENIGQIQLPEISNSQFPITNENPNDQNSETADWKTYTNTQYGFEIKYPSDWGIEEGSDKFFVKNQGEMNSPVLIIQFLSENYSNFLAEQIKGFNGKINDIIISGLPAKEFLYDSPMGDTPQTIILLKNNYIIKIISFKNSILDPILSTFKFIQ